jgi:hypothetical protein
MDDAETKEFAEFIATLPASEVVNVFASKQSFEKGLKEAQAVVELARESYLSLQVGSKNSDLILQALSSLDEIVETSKDKPFCDELKALIDKYKASLQNQKKVAELLDAIQAEITARNEAHEQLGAISTPPLQETSEVEKKLLEFSSLAHQNYKALWEQLIYVRNMSRYCVEAYARLKGKTIDNLTDTEYLEFRNALSAFAFTTNSEWNKVIPKLVKKYLEIVDQIAVRETYQSKLDAFLALLKQISDDPVEHRKEVSLRILGYKGWITKWGEELRIYRWYELHAKDLVLPAIEKILSKEVVADNQIERLFNICGTAWEKAEAPQFRKEDIENMKTMTKHPSLPLHFVMQFDLLIQMHNLKFHPKMKSDGTPEQKQLIAYWKLCKELMVKPSLRQDYNKFYLDFLQKVKKHVPDFQEPSENIDSALELKANFLKDGCAKTEFDTKKTITLANAWNSTELLLHLAYPDKFPVDSSQLTTNEIRNFVTNLIYFVKCYKCIFSAVKAFNATSAKDLKRSLVPLRILLKQTATFSKNNREHTKILAAKLAQNALQCLYNLMMSEPGFLNNLPIDVTFAEAAIEPANELYLQIRAQEKPEIQNAKTVEEIYTQFNALQATGGD